MVIIDKLQDLLVVSLGSILGTCTRFLMFIKLEKILLKKGYSILTINTFASFCLGFFLSFITDTNAFKLLDKLVLFFVIGFLGSLSSFSTFVYDLFDLWSKNEFASASKLLIISLFLGISSLALGYFLGNK